MDYSKAIASHLQESAAVKLKTAQTCLDEINTAVKAISQSITEKHKILICGNGGSAADAQHIAAEFIVRLSHRLERPAIPALALTTDTSVLTAAGNDIGFENIFARQVQAFGQSGDILLAISTSGNSVNILKAIRQAKHNNLYTIALLGKNGGQCKEAADLSIIVPSDSTQHIQEAHITIGHIIVELVEKTLYATR